MLSGRTVLVVETEFIIALGVQAVLDGMGASPVVVATSAEEAGAMAPAWAAAALAIIEMETQKPELVELARRISRSGIPVLGLSADERLVAGVPELPGTPIVIKPVLDADLIAAILGRLRQNPLPDVT